MEHMDMDFGELQYTRVIILLQLLHTLLLPFLFTHHIHRNPHSSTIHPYITQTIIVQIEIKTELFITHILIPSEEISDMVEHPVLTLAPDLPIRSPLTLKFQVQAI